MAEPGAPVPTSVDDIVDALEGGETVLLNAMLGNGATAEVEAALQAKADAAAVPVFVVLTRTPPGYAGPSADEELASLVHDELGLDGVYLVHTSLGDGHLAVYGDVDPAVDNDEVLFSLARYTAHRQLYGAVEALDEDLDVPAVTEAAAVLDIAASPAIPDHEQPVLSEAQVAAYTTAPWVSVDHSSDDEPAEPLSTGLGALVGVTVAVVVTAAAYRLLRAAVAVRSRRVEEAAAGRAEVADARESATTAVRALERALERRLPRRLDPGRRDLATGSVDTARELLDSDDLLDLVGAEVLARTGTHALRLDAPAYRCCFVDPRHGEAHTDADLPGGLAVPVCRSCLRALDRDSTPQPLREGRRPYYEGDSVWARTGYGALTDVLWVDVRRSVAR